MHKMKGPSPLQVEKISLWNVLIDITLTALSLSSPYLILIYAKLSHLGFFCNDDTIRYPYKASTVSVSQIVSLSTVIPVLTISAIELWVQRAEKQRTVLVGWWAVPEWIVRWVHHVLLFGHGFGSVGMLVTTGKFSIGRLRPHFLAACQPDVLCNTTDPHAFIADVQCTGVNQYSVQQSRMSFPSLHSAVAFYAAVFTVMYLEQRVQWPQRAIVVKTSYEVLLGAMAWFCSLSRVADYKHHLEDVMVGSLLGAACGWFWVRCALRLRPPAEDGRGACSPNSSAAHQRRRLYAHDSAPQVP